MKRYILVFSENTGTDLKPHLVIRSKERFARSKNDAGAEGRRIENLNRRFLGILWAGRMHNRAAQNGRPRTIEGGPCGIPTQR